MCNTSSLAVAYSYVPGFISENRQLTPLEKLTYLIIDSASGAKRFCWHSQKAIAEMVGCSLSTVIRAIRRLKALGLLRTEETVHGHTLRYYPLVPISRLQSSSCPVEQGGQRFKDRSLCQKDIQILKNNIKKKSLPLPPQNPSVATRAFPRTLSAMPVSAVPEMVGDNFSDFETLWDSYPRHEAKGMAFVIWKSLKRGRKLPPLSVLLSSISNAKETWAWTKDGGRYVPYLSNWLRGRRWMDFSPQEPVSVPVLPKIELPPMPKPPIITDEDKADFHHFLSGLPDSLSEGEESMVFALWRALRHSKGLTLMAADVGSGSGLLWRRMTIAAKRLTCRSIQS